MRRYIYAFIEVNTCLYVSRYTILFAVCYSVLQRATSSDAPFFFHSSGATTRLAHLLLILGPKEMPRTVAQLFIMPHTSSATSDVVAFPIHMTP